LGQQIDAPISHFCFARQIQLEATMYATISSMIALIILCLPSFGTALLPVSLWDGLVPSIIVDNGYAEFAPAFHGSNRHFRTVPSVVGQMIGSDELPLLKAYPRVEDMNEVIPRFRFLAQFFD
jgi:hypothetical protein